MSPKGRKEGAGGGSGGGGAGGRAGAGAGAGAAGGRGRSGKRSPFRAVPGDAHEWVSFDDPDELRTWVFDVTFMLSGWECIYGRGCKGVLTGPAEELVQGCCSYGAHFTDQEDVDRVKAAAKTLTAEDWQFAQAGRRGVVHRDAEGTYISRLVDGACIFLNRPGFPGGPGCALHRAALGRGQAPLELKPDVCWQLPLRREDTTNEATGRVTSTISQWKREHWGEGGSEFHWWCTEGPEAFIGAAPVYRTLADELTAMAGAEVYGRLVAYLDARQATGVPLPHPVLRSRRNDKGG